MIRVLESMGNAGIKKAGICPLPEIQRYAPDLRSMTSGQGIFTMEFEGYEDVPSNLEAKIIKESPFGGAKDEDDE